MAGREFRNPQVKVGTYDLSADADGADVESTLDSIDVTPFGAANKVVATSLGDGKITVDFFTDYRAGGPNECLRAFHVASKNGTPGTVSVLPENTTPSSTNQRATMTAWLLNYTDLSAKVGDASKFTAEFVNAGTAGITYGTV